MKEPNVKDLKKYLQGMAKLPKAKYITSERLSRIIGIYPEVINENLSEEVIVTVIATGFEKKEKEVKRKLNNINIPVLGICLGMQEMGLTFSGNLVDISLEVEEKNHDIKINNNTLLYSIVKTNYITVNSRHKSVVRDTNLIVSAVNGDIIEAIEDTNKRFFLGIQWHPENMYDTDIYAKRIFDYFIKMCHH